MFIYKNGEQLFFYNSAPGYFDGEDLPPKIEYLDRLLLEYKDVDRSEFMNILNLPAYSIGLGYNYIGAEKDEMEEFYKIKIEEIKL